MPGLPRRGALQGRPCTTPAGIPGGDAYARQAAAWSSAPTTRRTTSAPTCGSTAPTSPWCSARSTHIVRSDTLMEHRPRRGCIPRRRSRSGITTDMADLIFASRALSGSCPRFQMPVYEEMKERDADLYDRLEKAGFMLDFGDDGSGLFMKYLRRGSGYYIDVGASQLVVDGEHQAEERRQRRARSPSTVVRLTDGTRAAGRPHRLATGYGSMNGWARGPHQPGGRRQGRQVLGPGLGHAEGSGPLGGRAAQHVEADAAGGTVVPRRQPAPVAPLFAVPVAAAQGAHGGHRYAGLRPAGACTT